MIFSAANKGWQAGYRAAMHDMRKQVKLYEAGDITQLDLHTYPSDTVRLR